MAEQERVVYLEDLVTTKPAVDDKPTRTTGAPTASQDSESNPEGTAIKSSVGVKRQLSLFDMKGVSKGSSTGPTIKKAKLSVEGASTTTGGKSLNSIPFSQSAYEASLSEDEKKLLELEYTTMGKSWLKLLKDEIRKPYFLSLKRFLVNEGLTSLDAKCQIFPPPRQIYSWSNTPLGKVKVVIIGQDPYHGPGQAHGLCFSVQRGVAIPPSLKNIYTEIQREYPDFDPPGHGNLTAWAESGVLLLNTCLTVRARDANSHSKHGWEEFTDRIIDVVDKWGGANLDKSGRGRGIVFMAWGTPAALRTKKLDKKKHLILQSVHPSPLSAHRGFFGCGHFKAANEWLEAKYGPEGRVDWCKL